MANNHLLPATFDKIIEREQTTAPIEFTAEITRADLESLADLVSAKYRVAIFKKIEVAIRTHEENLIAITRFADEVLL